ncbi:Arc family DNA-binding protein [Endozoicomonas sp. SESOKO2]|uniref:Arc family DNA-binding protein n=1 Tax=Endozoicomonas sp. SESOKO2 TaxID=2828743 RepID=UPI002149086E|nr:Arc family DNA-binding protein [Endozoicomonas sp. SESOKO2]
MKQKQQNSYPLRLPAELREQLEVEAEKKGQSLNAEITQRLRNSLAFSKGEPLSKEQPISEAVLEELSAVRLRLDNLEASVMNADQYEQALRTLFRKLGDGS